MESIKQQTSPEPKLWSWISKRPFLAIACAVVPAEATWHQILISQLRQDDRNQENVDIDPLASTDQFNKLGSSTVSRSSYILATHSHPFISYPETRPRSHLLVQPLSRSPQLDIATEMRYRYKEGLSCSVLVFSFSFFG